jgi:dipeptidyl aminopeptidase/acylaminoacyl peptidase
MELSPDGTLVVMQESERAEQAKSAIVPSFVTASGYTEDLPSRTKVGDRLGRVRTALVSVETGEVVWIEAVPKSIEAARADLSGQDSVDPAPARRSGQDRNGASGDRAEPREREAVVGSPVWSDDGKNLVVTAVSRDNKDRWILGVDLATGKTRVIDAQHDDAWVAGGGSASQSVGWMPDDRSIYYIAEKTGWFHLYTAPVDGSGARPLTSGRFEVSALSLSRDKTRFYFTSSEAHPGERHFYSMPLSGGTRTRITERPGSHQTVVSPDEKTLAIVYSYTNQPPELYLMDNAPGAAPTRITTTPTEEWRSFSWVDPKLVTFRARDGAEVYARLYSPEMLNAGIAAAQGRGAPVVKRPAVVFVHGAGYLQNAHRWWSSYFREYMFHHVLMDRGFVVLDVDYRASSGYGRDWRTGIYRFMGGKDLDDQVDAARWLADTQNVDPARIGIYGGSYGGFITLMAMFTQPEVFAAGAALRPVTDWAHYNQGYTSNILNLPQEDEEAYRRSSPIYFAEGLRGALLICHGMVDTNVHFQDTVRLVERLIELRKQNWETAVYPVEDHGFTRDDSWVDEYTRILRLFETNLRRREPAPKSPGRGAASPRQPLARRDLHE